MRNISVLVVDDERDMYLSTKMALDILKHKNINVHVDYCESALSAIDKISYDDYEVILLDIVMESIEAGYQVIDYVKKKDQRTSIYIRSGLPEQLYDTTAITGIDGYLNKTDCTMKKLHEIVMKQINEE